jgi:hypothetical protein
MYKVHFEFAPGQFSVKTFEDFEEAKRYYNRAYYMYQSADLVDENDNLIYLWNKP